MAKFLFIYRGPGDVHRTLTPEQMQQVMEKWSVWIREGLEKGWMLDAGDALQEAGRVVSPKVVTDGPFVEAKEIIGGFSIIQADTIDAAAQLAKGCPCLESNGKVEVRPMAGYTVGK